MANLGNLLSQNIQREKQARDDAAAALEQMRTAEARRVFTIAKNFFEASKAFFIEGIMTGAPVSSLVRQVGGRHYSPAGTETHDEFCSVLSGYQHDAQGPLSLRDPKKFASLWNEFQAWAIAEGLVASWDYGYDGGGMDSWWLLKVAPAKASAS